MTLKKRSNGIFFIKFFDVVQGQTRRVSTGVRNKQLAQKFVRKLKLEQENNSKVKPITLSKFKQIYLEYTAPTYSKNYIKSIKLSFRKLEAFIKKI